MNSREFTEGLAAVRDSLPRLWWNVYQGCLTAGFNECQSFGLLQAYILSQCPSGIQPNNPAGPKADTEE